MLAAFVQTVTTSPVSYCTLLLILTTPAAVLLCTYANVLIKCAINNSSPAEWSVVGTTASQRHPVSPLMSLFLVVHYVRQGEYLPKPSFFFLCMFMPADINI